ncbi:MAG: twin-arginine translocase subunit TatC [Proteiniphilum sp.]|jgi:sec-independent protein translocase protein TatC|nr:twin-arginine translocase subunit TatC [Proteiniphilum sp.]MDD4486076.1 twin-arginine translocase subunit TatC [Proteiniphilum sp.]MDD5345002.1 twin-arginine translocase subunit TatC [Proteiniphilum sp.]MDD5620758.1 twin-arginine translocase subunit TatC [Proteiniphilum sp.]HHT33436.1 twin-arginine translocase subunit TatC [Bacteroidales bacterium]
MAEKEMSFWDHLEEFRWTLIRTIGAVLVFSIIGFIIIPYIFDSVILAAKSSDFVTYRFLDKASQLIPFLPDFSADAFEVQILNINMTTQFMTYISTSLSFGVLCTIPYILYELWKFISPALYDNEAKGVKTAFGFGGFMFVVGCLVGYFVVFPLIFRFLITFELSDSIENMLSLDSYMSNFYTLILIMGLVFELPLVFWLLSNLGLIYRPFFRKYRRHAVVGSLLAAALITPSGDPFSLIVVTVPIYMLWEISAFMVKKEPPLEEEEDEDLPAALD